MHKRFEACTWQKQIVWIINFVEYLCLKMAILQLADAYEELLKVSKTYIGRKIELVFNLFDRIFFDSSFRIQGCKCQEAMRYLNFQHQFLRCHPDPNMRSRKGAAFP